MFYRKKLKTHPDPVNWPGQRKRSKKVVTTEEKIEAVMEWLDTDAPGSFDNGFIESLHDSHEQYGELSPRQMVALDNIIESFNIVIEEYL